MASGQRSAAVVTSDSQGSSQLLRAIVLFGNGITGRPSFNGFAIGDQLIKNYGAARMRLYFSSGERNIRPNQQGYSRIVKTDNTVKPKTVNGQSSCLVIHSKFSTTNI